MEIKQSADLRDNLIEQRYPDLIRKETFVLGRGSLHQILES